MNHKGNIGIVMMLVFEALFVIILIGMLTSGATDLAESDSIKKINAAEEIRLIVNSLLAVPGDGVIEYPRGEGLVISLTSAEAQAYTEGETEYLWAKRTFVLPEGYTAFGTIKSFGSVCVQKEKTKIFLRVCDVKETAMFNTFKTLISSKVNGQGGDYYSYDAGNSITSLYFRQVQDRWEWSPDQINWMFSNSTVVAGGKWDGEQPVKENIALINFLNNYNPDSNLDSNPNGVQS